MLSRHKFVDVETCLCSLEAFDTVLREECQPIWNCGPEEPWDAISRAEALILLDAPEEQHDNKNADKTN